MKTAAAILGRVPKAPWLHSLNGTPAAVGKGVKLRGHWTSPMARATSIQGSCMQGEGSMKGAGTVTPGFLGERTGEQQSLPKNRY